jgi:molybdenum cofactor guanylyltransferase
VKSAAILAGGRATRYGGRDKGALVVDGETILHRQLAELSRIADDIMIVGAANAPVWSAAAVNGVKPRLVSDVVAGSGPLGGIHAALVEALSDAVFVTACDMPYPNADFTVFLLGLIHQADAVVPRTDAGYHPLCAVYSRTCLEPMARRLADRRLKMSDLLMDLRTRIVTPDELDRFGGCRLLANVNTPAEYAALSAPHDHER